MSSLSLNTNRPSAMETVTILALPDELMVQIFDYVQDPKTISQVCTAWNRIQDDPQAYRQILNQYQKEPLLSRFTIHLPEEVPLEHCKMFVQNIYTSVMQLAKEHGQLWWIPIDCQMGKSSMDLTPMMERIVRLEMYTPKNFMHLNESQSLPSYAPHNYVTIGSTINQTQFQHQPNQPSFSSIIYKALGYFLIKTYCFIRNIKSDF